MTLSLDYGEDQLAIGTAVRRFCERIDSQAMARQTGKPFPREAWQQLATLGVFTAAAPGTSSTGGAKEVSAICEALGAHAFPGPISTTYAALQVLPDAEAEAVTAGDVLVTLTSSNSHLVPFGRDADIVLARHGRQIHRITEVRNPRDVDTLGDQRAICAELTLGSACENSSKALALGHIASAAYLIGAAQHILHETADHVRSRRQFGQVLGEFQAVTHPLANNALDIAAAGLLARSAACEFDTDIQGDNSVKRSDEQRVYAGAIQALHGAARAARQTAFDCHQLFGALGVTLEGPLFHYTRRIQQLISLVVDAGDTDALLADTDLGGASNDCR